ncbi:hypothetical protein LWI29_004273 [Acer saccharum]|uniref:Uncharacterized protein n=1 Tax=Acer saccharum TaxID=4024 RepID=A0AA39RGX2_ACESA|nr:hypothetical protein LWI29_004273 [Acer saccharum]
MLAECRLLGSFDLSSMAQIQIQSETQHPNACFLCCFGVPRPEKSFKVVQSDNKKPWFRLKKGATKRTVPIDSAPAEKTNRQSNGKKFIIPKKTRHESLQNITFENRNSFGHVDSPKQKRRKIDAIKNGFSQPGSPDVKSISGRTATLSRTQSVSLPAPTREKLGSKTTTRRRQKHDPVVGLLIILMTLVILLIWGKACAILYTSAWFYILPLFRTNYSSKDESILVKSSVSDSVDPDLNAEECKKRVVLDGFLQRNYHRGDI